MQIVILSTGTMLNLPADLTLSIERTNTILEEGKGLTLPATLPLTATNRKALGMPDRIDTLLYDEDEDEFYYNAFPPIEVLLNNGIYQQRGMLSILSATAETVEVSIALDASFAWSRLEDVTVAQVLGNSYIGSGQADKDALIMEMEKVIRTARTTHQGDLVEYPFRVAPVLRKTTDDDTSTERMLNRYYSADVIHEDEPYQDPDTGYVHELCCFPLNTRKTSTDTYMYATAHLRLEYVLQRIFDYVGCPLTVILPTAVPDVVRDLPDVWADICLVNNTLDAAYSGRLYYRTLVPEDLKVKDLLRAVCAQFGAYFRATDDGMEMRFLCDLFARDAAEPDCEAIEDPSISFNDPASRDWQSDMAQLTPPAGTEAVFAGTPVTTQTNWTQHLQQYALVLDGFAQRVTTSTDSDGNDTTQNNACPLTFAYIQPVEVDMGDMDVAWAGYRGTRLRTPMALPVPVPQLRDDWAATWTDAATLCNARKQYTLNDPNLLAYRMNRQWVDALAQGMHRITATIILTHRQLNDFDMTQPLLIAGRRCLPVSLRGVLSDDDRLTFTLEAVTLQ